MVFMGPHKLLAFATEIYGQGADYSVPQSTNEG